MSAPTRLQRVVAFFAEDEDAAAVAVVRVVIGATLFFHLGYMLLSGEAQTVMTHLDFGGLQTGDDRAWASPAAATAVVAATAIAGAFMSLGLYTRAAVVASWVGMRLVALISAGAHGGTDALLIDLLLLLAFSGCGNTWSLDAWRRRRRLNTTTDLLAPRITRLLIVMQLVLLYTLGGLQKVSYGWVPGGDLSALWFALHQPQWTRFDGLPMHAFFPVTQLMTTSSWFLEVSAPILLVSLWCELTKAQGPIGRRLRSTWLRVGYLSMGVIMHVGIEVLMEIGPYMYVTCSMYAAVLGPAVVRGAVESVLSHIQRQIAAELPRFDETTASQAVAHAHDENPIPTSGNSSPTLGARR